MPAYAWGFVGGAPGGPLASAMSCRKKSPTLRAFRTLGGYVFLQPVLPDTAAT
jgi:hypothetical protein